MINIIGDEINNYRNKKYTEKEFFFDYLKKQIKFDIKKAKNV